MMWVRGEAGSMTAEGGVEVEAGVAETEFRRLLLLVLESAPQESQLVDLPGACGDTMAFSALSA